MRLRLIGLLLLSYFILLNVGHAAIPAPVVKIDATTMTAGQITGAIPNQGVVAGNFQSITDPAPVVERVAGRMAITFNGKNGLVSDFNSPANDPTPATLTNTSGYNATTGYKTQTVTQPYNYVPSDATGHCIVGSHPWTTAVWIYNPTLSSLEHYLSWTYFPTGWATSGNTTAIFGYGFHWNWGAASLYGNGDLTWGRQPVPKAGQWHHLACTFSGNGGTKIFYVDGRPVSAENNSWTMLNYSYTTPAGTGVPGIRPERIRFGMTYSGIAASVGTPNAGVPHTGVVSANGFSGSIASLAIYDACLAPTDILALAGASAPTGPYLFDPSFEFNYGNNTNLYGVDYSFWDPVTGQPWGSFTTGGNPSWGGNCNYGGAWNSASPNANTNNSNPGTGFYTDCNVGVGKWPYYNNDSTLVDGLGAVTMWGSGGKDSFAPAGNFLTYFNYLTGRGDSSGWSQPVWGLIPGQDYVAWGYFSAVGNTAGSSTGSSYYNTGNHPTSANTVYASMKIDDTYVFRNAAVQVKGNNGKFARVSGGFHVPATGATVFTFQDESRSTWPSPTTGNMACDKVGIAMVNSAPIINPIYKNAAYGENQVYFGGLQPDPTGLTSIQTSLTLSNDGGNDFVITQITVSGGGSDQFLPTIANRPNPLDPATYITVPAYGMIKSFLFAFSPTRGGIYNVNAMFKGYYVDADGATHTVTPIQVPMFGYSRMMIYNNSFEMPRNSFGEGCVVASTYFPGWTSVATGIGTQTWSAANNAVGFSPPGDWETWATNGNGGNPRDGSGTHLVDGNQFYFDRLQDRGMQYIKQLIPGFVVGKKYHVAMWAEAGREADCYTAVQLVKSGTAITSTIIPAPSYAITGTPLAGDTVIGKSTAFGGVTPPAYALLPSFCVNHATNAYPQNMHLSRLDSVDFSPDSSSAWEMRIWNCHDPEPPYTGKNYGSSSYASIMSVDVVKIWQVGSAAVAYTTTTAINFGEVQKTDTKTSAPICIANDGGTSLTVTSVTFTGANPGDFALLDNQGNPVHTPFQVDRYLGTSITLVKCTPSSEGAKSATMTIATATGLLPTGNLVVNLTADCPLAPALINGGFELKVPDPHDRSRYKMMDPLPLDIAGINQTYAAGNGDQVWNKPLGWSGYNFATDAFIPAIRTTAYDNGVGEGTFCYVIRKTAAENVDKTVWQQVPGFRANRTYHISAKFNTRVGQTGTAIIKLDGVTTKSQAITPADAVTQTFVNPFTLIGFDYTPKTDSSHKVEVGLAASATAQEIFIDDVRVEEVSAKIAVDQASLRFPDLVVKKQDGTNYSWFYPPTKVFLKISNVGYGGSSSLHFSTLAADSNTSFPGLKLTGDPSYKIVSVTPSTTVDLAVGSSLEVVLQFSPAHDANYNVLAQNVAGALLITTNDPNYKTVTIPLSANKVPVEMGSFNVE